MSALRLEPYVFRMLENQSKLQEWLRPHKWNWGLKTQEGLLSFTQEEKHFLGRAKQAVLGQYAIQLIGSESASDNTWLWAWANSNFGEGGLPDSILRGIGSVHAQAQRENALAFLNAGEVPIPDTSFCNAMAVICAGYMGAFAFFKCPFPPGGGAYVAIERCPEAERVPVSAINKINIISTGISAFALDHREAVRAYLGVPNGENNDMMIFGLPGQDSIHVVFDAQNRIKEMLTI